MSWTYQVPSESNPNLKHTVKFKDNVFSCSCHSWRKQYSPISKRTCKHLISLLGESIEMKRAPESFYGLTRKPNTQNGNHMFEINPMKIGRYDPEKHDVQGWLYSEKLNGAFGRWENNKLYTKSGRELFPPSSITDNLPHNQTLDGEIYSGVKGQNNVRHALSNDWNKPGITFVVFDLVIKDQPFQVRYQKLKNLQNEYKFDMVNQKRLENVKDLTDIMEKIQNDNKEGIVLRDPNSVYLNGKRSKKDLKLKPVEKSTGYVLQETPKKNGKTVRIREEKTGVIFNLFVPSNKSDQVHLHDIIPFKYSGRNDENKPEIPVLDL